MTDEFASSSRVVLRYAQETEFGVPPTTGNHHLLSMTGESLDFAIEKTQSEEINPDRGVTDVIATSASASGGVNVELKHSAYDALIEAGLQGAWTDGASVELDITATATELSIATGTFPVGKLVPGQFFGITSPAGQANHNTLLRVSTAADAVSAQLIKLDPLLPATPGAMTGVKISTSRLRNGTTRRSFTVEKHFSDVGVYKPYVGMNVSGFTLNAAAGALTTGEIQFMGRNAMVNSGTTKMPGSLVVAPDSRPMSGMTGTVCAVWVDDAPLAGTYVNSLALTLDNNMRQQNAMCTADANGVPGAVGIGNGQLAVSGTLEIYFSAQDVLYSEFVTNRNVKLMFTMFDTEGNGYVVQLPKANISSHKANAAGNNQDVMATIEYTGLQLKSSNAALNGAALIIDRIEFGA